MNPLQDDIQEKVELSEQESSISEGYTNEWDELVCENARRRDEVNRILN
jgi:hypothetical protein